MWLQLGAVARRSLSSVSEPGTVYTRALARRTLSACNGNGATTVDDSDGRSIH